MGYGLVALPGVVEKKLCHVPVGEGAMVDSQSA